MHPDIQKVLIDNNIPHLEIRHDSFNSSINSPMDFALALNYDLSRITKSVFLRSKSKEKYIMAVCSIDKKLNLPQLALLAQVNKLEVADKQDLASMVGYPPNGVSCIGIPANIETYIDKSLNSFQSILIGSGEPGIEIEISPDNLARCSNATFENIILS
jgi:Cys-tRNA(Pro)/Cys-tRNA(Cys) deacylase